MAHSADLRQRVRWRRANFIASMEGFGRFDIVLCRNALSAMEPDAREKVLANLGRTVASDGYLILGLDEDDGAASAGFSAAAGLPGVLRPDPERRAAAA